MSSESQSHPRTVGLRRRRNSAWWWWWIVSGGLLVAPLWMFRVTSFGPSLRHNINRYMSTGTKMTDEYCIAYTTASGEQEAGKLAEGLVAEKLVACVNIVPQIRSVYTWEGKVEDSKESLMIMKTRCALMPQVIQFVQSKHSYSVPECISMKIDQGSAPYLNWIAESTRDPTDNKPSQ